MDGMLMALLTTIGYSLPELLGCGIALAMLWSGAQPGKPRSLGLAGLGLMLACVLLQLAIGVYQTWMMQGGGSALDLQSMFMALGIVRLLVNCFFVGGIVMLAWAVCLSTRAGRLASTAA
ncbi:MAG: hypothetical protein EOP92_08060 [Lysobacteraceae bacterium]|nr:MAG: hypothetical protein EOP92_08060 [Xanthomonadaceae bacterium]